MHRKDIIATRLQEILGTIDTLFGKTERNFDRMDRRFDQMDRHFNRMDQRFDQVDRHFDHMHRRFDQIREEMATKSEVTALGSGLRAEMRAGFERVDRRLLRLESRIESLEARPSSP